MWAEQKYIGIISTRLERFKRVSDTVYNFRCTYCGDSKKNRNKARGYFIYHKGTTFYKCHNCGLSIPFEKFLKDFDSNLYKEYNTDKFVNKNKNSSPVKKEIEVQPVLIESPLKTLRKVSQLPVEHPAKLYVVKRKIPSKWHYKIFFTPNFKEWVNTFIPNKFSVDSIKKPDPRIVIPYLTKEGKFFGAQGRGLTNDEPRYITVIVNYEAPRVFGLDTINNNKQIYITEGPIDSFFIDNCLAMGGADIVRTDFLDKSKVTLIYDNEPRNKEIVAKMEKIIEEGYNIFLWPGNFKFKDINDWVLGSGIELPNLKFIIDQNTYSGLTAQLKLQQWKKV